MMTTSPKVSIIVTSYNSSGLVAEAIESAVSQTYQNFEIIVIDDGSTDCSFEVLNKLRDEHPDKILLYTHENRQNKGIVATYQLGISNARGEYVAFLEQDDTWSPNYLERKVEILDMYPEIGIVFSPYRVICERWFGCDMILRQWMLRLAFVKERPFDNFRHLIKSNNIATFSCFAVRKEFLNRVPAPSDDSTLAYDWWILTHLSVQTFFYCDDQSFANWRWSRGSAIGSGKFHANREEGLNFMEKMYASLEHHSDLLNETKRKIFFEHKDIFVHFLEFYKEPGIINFLNFLKLHPIWALASIASIVINYWKFR